MANKKIQLGFGTFIYKDGFYRRLKWSEKDNTSMNEATRRWFNKIKDKMRPNDYVKASPGMLLGMLNAGFTTLGLLIVNQDKMKVITLRSSDDVKKPQRQQIMH